MPQRLILLVEDSADDQDLFLRSLRDHEIPNPVRVAHNGKEAIDCLLGSPESSKNEPRPAFVVLDIGLPFLSGLEVLQRLRADPRTALLPVVMFSSSHEPQDVRAAYSHHANSYVCKPVDYDTFQETVSDMISYWLTRNQPSPA